MQLHNSFGSEGNFFFWTDVSCPSVGLLFLNMCVCFVQMMLFWPLFHNFHNLCFPLSDFPFQIFQAFFPLSFLASLPLYMGAFLVRDNRVITGQSVARYVRSLTPLTPPTCSAALCRAPLRLLTPFTGTLTHFLTPSWDR